MHGYNYIFTVPEPLSRNSQGHYFSLVPTPVRLNGVQIWFALFYIMYRLYRPHTNQQDTK